MGNGVHDDAGEMRGTHGGEGVVQVVQRPSNDHDVVNVEPEGEHGCSEANSCTHGAKY